MIPRSLGFLAVCITLTVAVQSYLWPHITDDAYITFRYAHHLASGEGLVFNPGERVEGFSNPFWTLILAGIHASTGISIPDIARALGLLLAIGSLIVLERIVSHQQSETEPPPAFWGLLFVVVTPGFHVYATAGLEGPLLSFLLVLGTWLSLRESQASQVLAALSFGLAGITRPEGPLYAALWFLATVRPFESIGELLRTEYRRFLCMIAPILAWQVFRFVYYDAFFPNTAIAKLPGVFGEFIEFPEYITPWIVALGGPLLLILWLLLPPRGEWVQRLNRIALTAGAACFIFVIYAQGDWMPFGRFIVPVLPVLAAAFALWLHAGWDWLRRSNLVQTRGMVAYLPALGIVASSYFAWQGDVGSYLRNEKMNMLMRGTDQIAVGEWITRNIAPSATVATMRLGGIGFAAKDHSIWDWLGLTDAEEARYIRQGRPGGIEQDPVFARRPDVIAAVDAPADWSYKRAIQLVDYLQKDYTFILGFPQGTYGYVDIWIRNERMERVFLKRDEYVVGKQ